MHAMYLKINSFFIGIRPKKGMKKSNNLNKLSTKLPKIHIKWNNKKQTHKYASENSMSTSTIREEKTTTDVALIFP